jgi:hypothetical protein
MQVAMLTIEYDLTRDGFVAAAQLASHYRSVGRQIRLWCIRLVGAYFVFVDIRLLATQPENRIFNFLLLLVNIGICSFSAVTALLASRRYKRMTQLHGHYVVTFSDEEIRYVAPSGASHLKWNVWGSYAEDKNSFVLGQRGSTIYMPIPKAMLKTEEIDRLRTILATHIKKV